MSGISRTQCSCARRIASWAVSVQALRRPSSPGSGTGQMNSAFWRVVTGTRMTGRASPTRAARIGGCHEIALALLLVREHGRVEEVVGVNTKELVPIGLADGNMGQDLDGTRSCVRPVKA